MYLDLNQNLFREFAQGVVAVPSELKLEKKHKIYVNNTYSNLTPFDDKL